LNYKCGYIYEIGCTSINSENDKWSGVPLILPIFIVHILYNIHETYHIFSSILKCKLYGEMRSTN